MLVLLFLLIIVGLQTALTEIGGKEEWFTKSSDSIPSKRLRRLLESCQPFASWYMKRLMLFLAVFSNSSK